MVGLWMMGYGADGNGMEGGCAYHGTRRLWCGCLSEGIIVFFLRWVQRAMVL
jgi:hypothetical protein